MKGTYHRNVQVEIRQKGKTVEAFIPYGEIADTGLGFEEV